MCGRDFGFLVVSGEFGEMMVNFRLLSKEDCYSKLKTDQDAKILSRLLKNREFHQNYSFSPGFDFTSVISAILSDSRHF
jgi:hypothetical protein